MYLNLFALRVGEVFMNNQTINIPEPCPVCIHAQLRWPTHTGHYIVNKHLRFAMLCVAITMISLPFENHVSNTESI